MSQSVSLQDLAPPGHAGKCDYEIGCGGSFCDQPVQYVILSATQPDGPYPLGPVASLAFVCGDHVDAEPLAQLEHAEQRAKVVGGNEDIWAALIERYPQPLSVGA